MPLTIEPEPTDIPLLIPPPHGSIWHLMLATSSIIEGPVDTDPASKAPLLANCLDMPKAGLIITGTRCRRPLMTREVNRIGHRVRRDAIVIRASDERVPNRVSFDIHLLGAGIPLMGYRLWIPRPHECAWLIPSTCDQPFVRLDPDGLDMQDEPPFDDAEELRRGLIWAGQFMSVATKGWF